MPYFDDQITFCRTADLECTSRFYEQTLGLALALDQGTCRIHRVTETSYLGFCRGTDAPTREGLILTLVTEDVDGWHDRLAAAGVEIEAPPRTNPDYLIYHFFIRDPDGRRVEIQRFDDPRWKTSAGS